MSSREPLRSVSSRLGDTGEALREIVMGLHWDPSAGPSAGAPVDLDAYCLLCDARGNVIEIVHPDCPRGAQGAVVHTGDSQDGASAWDDERIFVFLDALPSTVSVVAFVIASVTGETFDAVPGAVCHISDRITETERVRVDLTALRGRTMHLVAALCRMDTTWVLRMDDPCVEDGLLAQLTARVLGCEHKTVCAPAGADAS